MSVRNSRDDTFVVSNFELRFDVGLVENSKILSNNRNSGYFLDGSTFDKLTVKSYVLGLECFLSNLFSFAGVAVSLFFEELSPIR